VLTRVMRRLLLMAAVACTVLVVARTLRLRAEATAPLPSDPWPRVPDPSEL
jgi:hypothetical protein